MTKKEYRKPVVMVVNIGSATILAGSDVNTGNRYRTDYNDYIGFGGSAEGEID